MSNLSGHYLGRYHLIEQLGEGGMAVVYRAYDTRLERDVAVKIIRKNAFPPEMMDGVLKRFEREAKSLARLSHPNIVKVHDYGEHEGSPFLVLEYLSGGTLKERLRKPTSWQEAIKLLMPVARGVAYAHERGIIHRDIKPANILITESGEPMLSDFGIAKILDLGQTTTLTGTGMAIGTPEYMAPEQWTGKTSPQSDLYSLGIVLYEMVAGRKPYIADTPAAILLKQATEPLPRPCQFVPELPEPVERILIKSLAKDPDDRYQSVNALIEAVEGLSLAPIVPSSTQPVEQPEPPKAETIQVNQATIQVPKPEETFVTPVPEPPISTSSADSKSEFFRKSADTLMNWLQLYAKYKTSALLAVGVIAFLAIIGFAYNGLVANPTLVFSSKDGEQVSIYSYDGNPPKIVTHPPIGTGDWSPVIGLDGKTYFVSDRSGKAEIYFIDPKGIAKPVTDIKGQGENWSPVISPNGTVYFVSDRSGKAEIYFIDPKGIVKPVTDTKGQGENWSPAISLNGTVYFVSDRSGKAEIYFIDPKGIVKPVTDTKAQGENWSPAISPNGTVYFVSNRSGKAEIYFIDSKGIVKPVTDIKGQGENWGPVAVGENIYFTSNRSGKAQVYKLGKQPEAISDQESWTKQSQRNERRAP